MHAIVETTAFTARLDRLAVTAAERTTIYDVYSSDPAYGSLVKRTGGLRKGRIAKHDTGKSSGHRVFSFFANASYPAFPLCIIDKTKDASLSDAQEAAFRKLTMELKQECK